MARNEEKQLARLNRFYLQQQKDEALKKRPPRPKLDSLCTPDEVKKWLPSILSDIDFYLKQMEVTCYPQRQIEEFNQRVDRLRGEYKAFIRKIRQLEPDVGATPWTDRPYSKKKRSEEKADSCEDSDAPSSTSLSVKADTDPPTEFQPLGAPVLQKDSFYERCYGYSQDKAPITDNRDIDLQDEPLQLNLSKLQQVTSPSSSKPLHKRMKVSKTNLVSSTSSGPLQLEWSETQTAAKPLQFNFASTNLIGGSSPMSHGRGHGSPISLQKNAHHLVPAVSGQSQECRNTPFDQSAINNDSLVKGGSAGTDLAQTHRHGVGNMVPHSPKKSDSFPESSGVRQACCDESGGLPEQKSAGTSVVFVSSGHVSVSGSLGLPYTDSSSSDENS